MPSRYENAATLLRTDDEDNETAADGSDAYICATSAVADESDDLSYSTALRTGHSQSSQVRHSALLDDEEDFLIAQFASWPKTSVRAELIQFAEALRRAIEVRRCRNAIKLSSGLPSVAQLVEHFILHLRSEHASFVLPGQHKFMTLVGRRRRRRFIDKLLQRFSVDTALQTQCA